MFPDRTDLPISRILQALRDHKEGSLLGRADLQDAPASSDGSAGSVQPAAGTHFRLTTVKNQISGNRSGSSASLPHARPGPDDSTGSPALRCTWTAVTDSGLRLPRVQAESLLRVFFYAISFYIWCVSNLFTSYLDFLNFLWAVSPISIRR